MTVETTDRKEQFVIASGTTDYAFTFRAPVDTPTDIKCTVTDANDVETALVYTTDYTVVVSADGVGGTVTLVSPASYDTETLTVYRETTKTQESDYEDYNQFPADTLEKNLDLLMMIVQDMGEDISRSLKLPISGALSDIELPPPEADTVIGWDSTGTALQNYTFSESGVLTLQDAYDNGNKIIPSGSLPVEIEDASTGGCLLLDQNGNGVALSVQNAGNLRCALFYHDTTELAQDYQQVNISSGIQRTNSNTALLYLEDGIATSTEPILEINNDSIASSVYIDVSRALAANTPCVYVYNSAAQVNNGTALFAISNIGAGSEPCIEIDNDGTGSCIEMSQDGNGIGILLTNAGTANALRINQDGIVDSNLGALQIYNNVGSRAIYVDQGGVLAANQPCVKIWSDAVNVNADSAMLHVAQTSASATEPCIEIDNDGSGSALEIDHSKSSGTVVSITSASAGIGLYFNQAGVNNGSNAVYLYSNAAQINNTFCKMHLDNTSSSQGVLELVNDGTGYGLTITCSTAGSSDLFGIIMSLTSGSGNEFAFRFNGDEIIAASVGGSQDKKIKCSIAGATYYIPLHTA